MSRDWLVSVCEMLDFGAVKCDLFYACGASISIKLLCEMRIIQIIQIDYTNKSKFFGGLTEVEHIGGLTYIEEAAFLRNVKLLFYHPLEMQSIRNINVARTVVICLNKC